MAITQGRSLNCATDACCAGGVGRYWIANATDVDIENITRDGNNKVDSLPMVASGVFYEIQVQPETSTSSTPMTRTGCCTTYTVSTTGQFDCIKQADLDLVQELGSSCCGFVVIFRASNGSRFIFGIEPDRAAKFQEGTIDFGTALEDANAITWTLQAKQLNPMAELATGLVIPV